MSNREPRSYVFSFQTRDPFWVMFTHWLETETFGLDLDELLVMCAEVAADMVSLYDCIAYINEVYILDSMPHDYVSTASLYVEEAMRFAIKQFSGFRAVLRENYHRIDTMNIAVHLGVDCCFLLCYDDTN